MIQKRVSNEEWVSYYKKKGGNYKVLGSHGLSKYNKSSWNSKRLALLSIKRFMKTH